MTFFELLSAAQKIYALYGFIENTLTDHMSLIMREIAEAEMVSAIKTLEDSKISNNREREFASAVTQLRLALEKIKDDLVKAKITAVIWFCYILLEEAQLARSFQDDSIRYFNSYCDRELRHIVVSSRSANFLRFGLDQFSSISRFSNVMQLIRHYNQLVDTAKDIGLDVVEKEIGSGEIIKMELPFYKNDIEERATRLVKRAKSQYAAMFRDSLPKLALKEVEYQPGR